MSQLIAWCGFFGAWLLVAGPIYQAAIEIDDEEFEREDFAQAVVQVPRPPRVSRWWLLLPPVAYVLWARRRGAWEAAVLDVLNVTQLEQLMHLRETAAAWLFVGSGAALIAAKETWELREEYEWATWVFWALLGVMLAVCIANTAFRIGRRQKIVGRAREDSRGASRAHPSD